MDANYKKEKIDIVVFEGNSGKDSKEYTGRFIGVINKKQTSAILNSAVLQKRIAHLETKKLSNLGTYSDEEICDMRAVSVVNKIGSKTVIKFLYITELLDSVVYSNKSAAHLITKDNGYIMFNLIDNDVNNENYFM